MNVRAKTHWLVTPNKNYLGHQDLPNGSDVILTIKSAGYEDVENPKLRTKDKNNNWQNTVESKRIVRFKESIFHNGNPIKPFICNETNANSILLATGFKFMEDSVGARIQLYIAIYNDKKTKEQIDCIRIRKKIKETSDNLYTLLIKIFKEKEDKLTVKEKKAINNIIEKKEEDRYDKAIAFLINK